MANIVESDKNIIASKVVSDLGINMEPNELIHISQQSGVNDLKKIGKYIMYAESRLVNGMSRYDAFKHVFPERCVVSDKSEIGTFKTNKPVGSELSKSSIEVKAKRLENTKLYKSIVAYLTTSLYVLYAADRIKVMDLMLDKIFDPKTKEVHRIEYVKTFLNETKKPEENGIDININVENNNFIQIEQKLDLIANKLSGLDASSIINIIGNKNG